MGRDLDSPSTASPDQRLVEHLQAAAQQEAATWKAVGSSLLQKLLRKLPNKAAGPDGVSYDMLRHLPYPAVTRLASLLTEMEKTALLPTQLRCGVERPIALTSCLYRVWNSYRKADICRSGLEGDH